MKKQTVLSGIDRADTILPEISGARIGLITNQTGVNKNLKPTVDILHERGLLSCLFSPEHGIRGSAQAGAHIGNYTDSITGLPVYSLYGQNLNIDPDILEKTDIIAFDIQDIGARYYTYTSTLAYAMEDCAKADKKIIVFDRINPIGGRKCEGSVLEPRFSSFVGRHAVATRHGMTVGEYAKYINETENINCNLSVIPLDGWDRELYYNETDLSWVMPSPNMPTIETAICYIGTCLAEGTNLSEGRGTTKPFELIGAPWLRNTMIADEMNRQNPDGVILRPCDFTPAFSKYAGVHCNGIQLHITDRDAFNPFETAMRLFELIRRTHKEFVFIAPQSEEHYFIDLLLGSDEWRKDSFDINDFLKHQKSRCKEYSENAKKYFMY